MKKKIFLAEMFEDGSAPVTELNELFKNMSGPKAPKPGKRTVVLCLDGVTISKVSEMISKGKLGNFKTLIEEGVSGGIASTVPPNSVPAWISFMTGNNPGAHGILDFSKYVPEIGKDVVINSNMLGNEKYWDLFSDSGLKTVTINLPCTFPPQKTNGIVISGQLTPADAVFTYPEDLSEPLSRAGYFAQSPGSKFFDFDLTEPGPYLYKMRKVKEAGLSIMRNYDWDLFTMAFITPDKAHHMMGIDGDSIDAIYDEMDDMLGDVLEVVDRDLTDIFIVSDHGVTTYEREFSLNTWLYSKGLIKTVNSVGKKRGCDEEHKEKGSNGLYVKLLKALYKVKVKFSLPSIPFFYFPKNIIESAESDLCSFDWGRTKVFSLLPPTSNFLPVFINTKGERRQGIVEKGAEYDELIKSLIRELEELTDTKTGEKIVERIFQRKELYSGEFTGEMPDIVVKLDDRYLGYSGFADLVRLKKGPIFKHFNDPVVDHCEEGIFIFSGPSAANNMKLGSLFKIEDVYAAILHAGGVPDPDSVDSVLRPEIFDDNYQPEMRAKAGAYNNKESKKRWESRHSPEDIKMIEDELKRLGYRK